MPDLQIVEDGDQDSEENHNQQRVKTSSDQARDRWKSAFQKIQQASAEGKVASDLTAATDEDDESTKAGLKWKLVLRRLEAETNDRSKALKQRSQEATWMLKKKSMEVGQKVKEKKDMAEDALKSKTGGKWKVCLSAESRSNRAGRENELGVKKRKKRTSPTTPQTEAQKQDVLSQNILYFFLRCPSF